MNTGTKAANALQSRGIYAKEWFRMVEEDDDEEEVLWSCNVIGFDVEFQRQRVRVRQDAQT